MIKRMLKIIEECCVSPKDQLFSLEESEHENQRELSRLYRHKPDDSLQSKKLTRPLSMKGGSDD